MSSIIQPNIVAFRADAALSKGQVVKPGTDSKHVAKCSANTDAAIGIVQNDVSAAEGLAEVAMVGGGAKALAGETITAGQFLVPHTDGSVVKTNADGDNIIAQALEDAVAGDLFSVAICPAIASGADN
jgi:hypothetical protein